MLRCVQVLKNQSLDSVAKQSNGHHKLADRAYFIVRNAILSGELGFGQSITRRGISEQLGMSFVPVSEALQRLEHEGFVESTPRVGTQVRKPNELDIRGHFAVREALEGHSARLFSRHATSDQQQMLISRAKEVDQEFHQLQPNRERYSKLHERFHLFIAECLGFPTFTEVLKRQVAIWTWLGSRLAWETTVNSLAHEEHPPWHWHEQLARAINCGEPEIANRAMRQHVRRGLDVVLGQFELRTEGSTESSIAGETGPTAGG